MGFSSKISISRLDIANRFSANALIYLSASLSSAVLSFIMLRYFTKYLDARDYGIFGYVTAVNTFLLPLFTLSLNSFYIKEYYVIKDEQKRKDLLGAVLMFMVVWSIILTALTTVSGQFVFRQFSFSFPFFPYMFLTLLCNLFIGPITLLLLQYRLVSRPWAYFMVSLLQSILLLGVAFFFVSVYRWGVYGRILGNFWGTAILGLICIILIRPFFNITFNKVSIKEGIKFCIPLVPYSLIVLSFDTLDRFFLERYKTDLASIGLYNVGFQYASVINMFTLAFYRAYEPEIYKLMAAKNETAVSKTLIKLNSVVFAMSILLIVFSHWTVNFLTNGRFAQSAALACYLVVAFFFKSAYTMLNTVLIASSRNRHMLLVSILGLVILLGASLVFVRSNGIAGTLWIKIVLYFVTFSFGYLMLNNKKVYRNYFISTYGIFLTLLLLSYLLNN